ncbi:5'-nucleotidase C-terminal domain-containing protein [Paenibacillus sp. P96]|uniref:5'-nucleotidase C-terminal domain-containing protein n=1 Tax=Paenibacillus zeirhizosphaerae TaxID=2987519 RepID=A0ABT9FWA4_9BACL|nr:5'-nucleotidase C-terminal domain-containing protein [Paenibacillus sp. P96]MDP4098999.1 5'-nucleotidase C-terminal domain-containing protein [Paenibacillus sp. P96]
MNQWKKLSSAVLSASVLFGSFGAAVSAAPVTTSGAAAPEGSKHITLLHTNDVHSHAVENKEEMGYAKLAGIIDKYRGENPDTLLLDAGDSVHGTTFATLVNGESVVKVMNEMGYDAMAPGNHEFNYGWQQLVKLSGEMKFPLISANVKQADGNSLFKPYVIKEVDGVKIGIIGLTTPETAYKTNPKNVEGIDFANPAEETQAIVNEIKDQVDVVVAVGHVGQDKSSVDTSLKVAQEVPGIDVFIDGHSHTVLQDGLVGGNGTLIASTGEYSKFLGVVDLYLDENNDVVSKKATLVDAKEAADIQPDAEVDALVKSIQAEQKPILEEKVANSAVNLNGERENVRAGETNLGDLVADAIRDVSGADVALTNGGGIRTSIPAGDVTKGQVISVLPFGNQVVTLEVTGADIKAALENGVAAYPEPSGGFPQVSGMTFQIDTSAAAGSRVTSLMIGGKAYDPAATYTLATNDFTAVGGDQYTVFTKYPQAGMFGSLDEALISYMQELGAVNVQTDGRITEAAGGSNTGAEPVPAPVEPTPVPEPAPAPEPTPVPEVQEPAPVPAPKPSTPQAPEAAAGKVYVIKAGDTLYSISKKHGTTWQELQKLNKIKNAHWIYPGQKIKLPA